MNEEIKEILIQLEYFIEENYKYYNNFELNENQIKQLLDYITNLQMDIDQSQEIMAELTEENERLKEE